MLSNEIEEKINKQGEPMDELVENTINEIQNNLEGE